MSEIRKYDVVIIGGGTSGCACAYNCAKNNLKTLLVEKNNFLGGLMTAGLVVPIMKSSVKNINCKFYKKLIATAKKYNSQITYKDLNDGWLNPEMLKIILDDILTSPSISKNLDILLETQIKEVLKSSKSIKKIILSSNLLSIPIVSKYFIDATGSGEFSKLCECDFLDDNEGIQQNSLRFILGNVDIDTFSKFITKLDKDENITNTYRNDLDTRNEIHFTTASTWDTTRVWALDTLLKKAIKEKVLNANDRAYFQVFSIAGAPNCVAFNCPRIENKLNNPFEHSKELIQGRKAIYRLHNFAKKYLKGFENSIIINISSQTGIREQKRIKSRYIYSKEDMLSQKKFKTPVLSANYGIDIHSKDKKNSHTEQIKEYQLPIESLISANINNLFAIGKLVGAEIEAHSALRVQKSCMSMGEGVANYIYKLLH